MNSISDTLTLDQSRIQAIIDDGSHDYYNQKLVEEHHSAVSESETDIDIPDPPSTSVGTAPSLILTIIGVLFLAFFLYMLNKQGLFKDNVKNKEPEDTDDDNSGDLQIEGIDFEKELKEAESSGNWESALRFTYLYALRHLSDTGVVEWKQHKTPSDYSIEAGNRPFHHLTNLFLRSHYGMYGTSEEEYREAYGLYQQVKEGGES